MMLTEEEVARYRRELGITPEKTGQRDPSRTTEEQQRPHVRRRDEVLDRWVELRDRGYNKREAAAEMGMSFQAFDRTYQRARAAGDPRAVTLDGRMKARTS